MGDEEAELADHEEETCHWGPIALCVYLNSRHRLKTSCFEMFRTVSREPKVHYKIQASWDHFKSVFSIRRANQVNVFLTLVHDDLISSELFTHTHTPCRARTRPHTHIYPSSDLALSQSSAPAQYFWTLNGRSLCSQTTYQDIFQILMCIECNLVRIVHCSPLWMLCHEGPVLKHTIGQLCASHLLNLFFQVLVFWLTVFSSSEWTLLLLML